MTHLLLLMLLAAPPHKTAAPPLILDAELGLRAVHRRLTTTDDLFGRFYPHTQPIALGPTLRLRYFPGAHFTRGVGAWFGLYGHANWAPALGARLPDDTRLDVATYEAGGGLVFKYAASVVELAAEVGALVNVWRFSPPTAGTLSLTYIALRPAFDARFNLFTHFALRAGIDLRVPLVSPSEQFPHARGVGFRALAAAIVPLVAGLELRLEGEYLHYALDMRSQPGDSAVLGGILDQSYGGTLALAYRL